jgi:hypothetical protein
MSLNRIEVETTRRELQANFALSELSAAEVCADLTWSHTEFAAALSVEADPVDVWLLRDYLEQAVTDHGLDPAPFTVLTEQSRTRAVLWFDLQRAPHHLFADQGVRGSESPPTPLTPTE